MFSYFFTNFTFFLWIVMSFKRFSQIFSTLWGLKISPTKHSCSCPAWFSFCIDFVHHAVLLKKGDQHFGWAWRAGAGWARGPGGRGGTVSQQPGWAGAEKAGPSRKPGWAHQDMFLGTFLGHGVDWGRDSKEWILFGLGCVLASMWKCFRLMSWECTSWRLSRYCAEFVQRDGKALLQQ